MLFQRTLYRAVRVHYRTGRWPLIVGRYDGTEVTVRRTEDASEQYANGAFAVTVQEEAGDEDLYIADGLIEVKRYLRWRDLHVTHVDWRVESEHIHAEGQTS